MTARQFEDFHGDVIIMKDITTSRLESGLRRQTLIVLLPVLWPLFGKLLSVLSLIKAPIAILTGNAEGGSQTFPASGAD